MEIKFRSSLNRLETYNVIEAATKGLAPDGGLMVPTEFPDFSNVSLDEYSYESLSKIILKPFFKNTFMEESIDKLCAKVFSIPLPLHKIDENTEILELFHGPTLAFKDFGAIFFAECMELIAEELEKRITIIVATSGDTGGAAASAIYEKKKLELILLYPELGVSKEQELFLNRWDKNIFSYKVAGNFDDCQRMVKEAFFEKKWQDKFNLNTVNSINVLRILAQMTYYAYVSLEYQKKYKKNVNFIIPSGNFGNGTSAYWAKYCGFPVNDIHMPVNSNKFLPTYLKEGRIIHFDLIKTLANAMDVAKPSNFERIIHLFAKYESVKKNVFSYSVSDSEIINTITVYRNAHNYILCPHSATAAFYQMKYAISNSVLVATASPNKFAELYNSYFNLNLKASDLMIDLSKKPINANFIETNLDKIFNNF
jgi:threonine synthase